MRYLRAVYKELIKEDDIGENTMQKEEILRTLTSCGLSEYESRAYSSLVFLGTAKASIISKDSQVPQSKIYDVLEQLMEKQLVEMFDGRPKEFKAVEPEIALTKLLENRSREIEYLKAKIDTISKFLRPTANEETINGIWVIKGKKWIEFFDKIIEMSKRSKKYMYGVTRDYSRSPEFGKAIRACVKRGVDIRVIGLEAATGRNYYKAKWYHEQGAKVRVFETKVHPRIALVDGREVLLRLDHNPAKRNRFRFSAIWSEDPSLVRVFDSYVKNLWKAAKPVNFRKISNSNI